MLILFICIGGGLYALFSIGVATLAKRRGLKAPWRAWVPFISLVVLAEIADNISYNGMMSKYSKRMLGSLIIFLIANTSSNFMLDRYPQNVDAMLPLFFCAWLSAIVYVVTLHQSCYRIYKAYTPASAVMYTAIGLFFPFIIPVLLFTMKDYTQKFGIR